jgi:hypothetical protein
VVAPDPPVRDGALVPEFEHPVKPMSTKQITMDAAADSFHDRGFPRLRTDSGRF